MTKHISLYETRGIARLSGTEINGAVWTQELYAPHDNPPFVDCQTYPNCDADWSALDIIETCPGCGKTADELEDLLRPTCIVCKKPVYGGWVCLDGGDMACEGCVVTHAGRRSRKKAEHVG